MCISGQITISNSDQRNPYRSVSLFLMHTLPREKFGSMPSTQPYIDPFLGMYRTLRAILRKLRKRGVSQGLRVRFGNKSPSS